MARTLTREQLRAMFAAQRGGEISLSSRDTKLNREAEKVGAAIHTANEEARKRNDVILARRKPDFLTRDRIMTLADLNAAFQRGEGRISKKEGEKRSAQITFGSGERQITKDDLRTTVTQAQIRAVRAQNEKARARRREQDVEKAFGEHELGLARATGDRKFLKRFDPEFLRKIDSGQKITNADVNKGLSSEFV